LASNNPTAVLQAAIGPKLALVAQLAFTQGRAGLVGEAGAGVLSNNGGSLISSVDARIVANNGGAYRLMQVEVAAPAIATSAKAGETLVGSRNWPAGDHTLEFFVGDWKTAIANRLVHTTAAGEPRFEGVSEVEEQFADKKVKVQRFEQVQLGNTGELRLMRKSRQTSDETGGLTSLAFLPNATKVRMPEIGAMVDIDAFEIQPKAKTGSYTYRFPTTGNLETGTLKDVGPDANGGYWFSYGDALGYYSGEADVKDSAGKLLFHKSRKVDGAKVTRGYDLGDGVTMDLDRVDANGQRTFQGPLAVDGKKAADVVLAFMPDGTTVFDLTYLEPAGAKARIGWGVSQDASPAPSPTPAAPRAAWKVATVVQTGLKNLRGLVASRTRANRWFAADMGNERVIVIDLVGGAFTVKTYAGAGTAGDADGPALTATFRGPFGLAAGADDTLFVSEINGNRIRRIAPVSDGAGGAVEVLVGDAARGFADAAGKNARFYAPSGVALVGSRLYVADQGNDRVRAIDLADSSLPVTTLAGGGAGTSADGTGSQAAIDGPLGLAASTDGILYVTESNASKIRRVDPATGAMTTVTGTGRAADAFIDGPKGVGGLFSPLVVLPDGTGGLFTGYMDLRYVKADGSIATLAGAVEQGGKDGEDREARFTAIYGLVRFADGRLLATDSSRLRLLTPPR
jgi:sugar lactone lactonase YvrE